MAETLRYGPVLEALLDGAALLRVEKKLPPLLAKVRAGPCWAPEPGWGPRLSPAAGAHRLP